MSTSAPAPATEAAAPPPPADDAAFRKKPIVLLFMGMAGSGKTTLVQRLNLELNAK